MIGNITYEDYNKLILILQNANENVKKIVDYYTESYNAKTEAVKVNRFTSELDNYITYLKNTYEINVDADKALATIKELNS